jgi:hypothetical protein
MEFYSAIKKNETLSFISKRMKLENIIVREVRQVILNISSFTTHNNFAWNTKLNLKFADKKWLVW